MNTLTAVMVVSLAALPIPAKVWAEPITNTQVLPRQSFHEFMKDPAKVASFAKAIRVMKSRPVTDPTSWKFQANIHGNFDSSNPLWNQCQHQHWWFLAWHRAYLYYFEKMLQKASGNPGLRLPYWDYTDPHFRSLPQPFLDKSTVFYVNNRLLRSSKDELRPTDVDSTNALSSPAFIGSAAQHGFGGGKEAAPVQFPFEDKTGSLENVPHNAVHVKVGGLMLNPLTAANDPIFWLHHCNIDRLWELWLKTGQHHVNPSDTAFLETTFTLFDENGKKVTHPVRDFMDTQKLGYSYPSPAPSLLAQINLSTAKTPSTEVAENIMPSSENVTTTILAETKQPKTVQITGQPVTLDIKPNAQTPAMKVFSEGIAISRQNKVRFLLEMNGISFTQSPTTTYEIYLNMPSADHTTVGQTKSYIGTLAFFEHPHGPEHPMKELSRTFDITDTVQALQLDQNLDINTLTVTIVPTGIIHEGKPQLPDNPAPIQLKSVKIISVEQP